jgi:putative sterol carrier protein
MAGRIKVRGDLLLAQKLEEVFEKAGGRDVG